MPHGFQFGMWKYLFIVMACVILLCSAVLMWGIHSFHLLTGQVWVSLKMLYFKHPTFLHMHKTVEMINIHNLQANTIKYYLKI